MSRVLKIGICIIIGFLCQESRATAQQPEQITIERIDIRGNRRIPEDTVRFYIQSRPGEPFDRSRLEFDLRALYKANFFENVEILETDGDTGKIVTFVLKEKPLIRSLEYSGYKSFTESDILNEFKTKKIGLTVDSQYDPSKIRAAERALKDLMTQNGKPLGTVRSEVEPIPPSNMRVRFILEEGAAVRIGRIRFVGNTVFNDGELKGALKLDKERSLMTAFKGMDKYHQSKLEYDIETNLKAYYKDHGYMQIQVGQPTTRIFEGPRGPLPLIRKTKQQFFVEIPIESGEQYRLGKLELKNCGVLNCDALTKAFGMNPGDVIVFKKVKDTLDQIKKVYGNYGYINWSYIPEQNLDNAKKTMDFTFDFQPDRQFFVRRIYFEGNTKTRDRVMRREFALEEGKVFSTQLLDVSVLRLNQLGFFEKIEEKDYEVKPDEKAGTVDVSVKVKEKSQQSIGFQGGVSGISGSFLGLNYSTNNFMGRGESIDFGVTAGTRTTDFTISFTEPYLLDSRWSLNLSVFNQRYRYDTYSAFGVTDFSSGKPTELFTQRTAGVSTTVSRRLGYSFWSFGSSYSYQKIKISGIAPGFESYALGQFVGSVSGKVDRSTALTGIRRSEVTPMLTYNSTNDYFSPTAGTALNLSFALSGGALGGSYQMVRPSIELRRYLRDRWLSQGRNTFGFRFIGQYIFPYGDSSIPFYERFFIGGETTIRGFDLRSISPLAIASTRSVDSNGTPIVDPNDGLKKVVRSIVSVGGDTSLMFNLDYRMPIAGPLSISLFYDAGISSVTRKSSLGSFGASTTAEIIGSTNYFMRSSTGVEFQFLLPIISAPFRLILALNPQRYHNDVFLGSKRVHIHEKNSDFKFTIGRSF